MYQSKLFTKTRKEAPKDEVSKNAQLLIRAGFIHKEMAGAYSFLPLGLIVLNKVNNIIREEMNNIGGQEIFMTSLQDKNLWQATNRWDDALVDNWFKTSFKNGGEVGLGFTHEEPITNIMKNHIRSFRDLPVYAYQIQTKFRNESRAKSGIMRCREFLMKDLYSFSRDNDEHNLFYEKSKVAYKKIFERVGLGDKTYLTFASGGVFSKYSHEFQTVSLAGEDKIYICDKCRMAVNNEIIADQSVCPECGSKDLREDKAIEVGNIFCLGTRFSDALCLNYLDEKGDKKPIVMGSYGIGPGRLMGTVVEVLSDEKGMIWPKEIAPFNVHILNLSIGNEAVNNKALEFYQGLQKAGLDVMLDDRDARAGEKFNDADLMGIPTVVVVSEKALEKDIFEVKDRKTGKVIEISGQELIKYIVNNK